MNRMILLAIAIMLVLVTMYSSYQWGKVETITLPAFEVEHDTKQVIKMGWER